MQYFDTLPKLIYTDQYGTSSIRTNLLARASLLPSLFKTPLIYYQYDVQEGDTPEIVAHKYYNDAYRYWIVLFANQLLDPQWDWPLNSLQFQNYITDKYGTEDVYGTVHHYEKIVTESNFDGTTTNNVTIDEATYNSLVATTNTYNLPTGPVTVTITPNAVSIYDYELSLNESKRTINILNSLYVDQLETEFRKLMSV
jgi:hypothetical protein